MLFILYKLYSNSFYHPLVTQYAKRFLDYSVMDGFAAFLIIQKFTFCLVIHG